MSHTNLPLKLVMLFLHRLFQFNTPVSANRFVGGQVQITSFVHFNSNNGLHNTSHTDARRTGLLRVCGCVFVCGYTYSTQVARARGGV